MCDRCPPPASAPYREGRPVGDPPPPTHLSNQPGALAALGMVLAATASIVSGRSDAPPSPYIESCSSLTGGAQVLAVVAERDGRRRDVLRVPGRAVWRDGDLLAPPEVLEVGDALRALPGGDLYLRQHAEVGLSSWPLDQGARFGGRWFSCPRSRYDWQRPEEDPLWGVIRGAPRGDDRSVAAPWCALREPAGVVCGRELGPESRGIFAALGALGGGGTSPGGQARWLPGAARVDAARRVACVRGDGGEVRCALEVDRGGMAPRVTPLMWVSEVPMAKAVAVSNDDVCLLAADDSLWCVRGPTEDADGLLDEAPLRLRRALENVDEIGLTTDVGCVRRGGRIECWGRFARGGWVLWRERPVVMEGPRDVSALVAHEGMVFALGRGEVWAWGTASRVRHRPIPRRLPLPGAATDLGVTPDGVCATVGGERICMGEDATMRVERGALTREDATAHHGPPDPGVRGVPGLAEFGEVHVFAAGVHRSCALNTSGRVACSARSPTCGHDMNWRAVPGLEGATQLAVAGDLACAARGDGAVVCWGDNASGALTLAASERSPRLVTLHL